MLIFHFGLFVFLFVLSFACFSNSIKALLLFFTFLAFFHRKSKMFRKHLHFLSLSLSLPPFKYLLTLSLFSSIIHILSLSHPSCRKCESIREREFQILVTQSLVSLFLASAKAINPLYNETKQTFCRRINFSNLFNVYFKTAIFVIQY